MWIPHRERAQSTLTHAPLWRPPRFPTKIFNLSMRMREPKTSLSSFAFIMSEEEGAFHSVSGHPLATAAKIFGWIGESTEGEVASAIKGGLRCRKGQWDKQALQIFLGRLQLDDADVLVYKGTKLRACCLPSCGKSLFWMCMERRTCHLINISGGVCKCGVGSVVHCCKSDRSHSDAAVLCAGVSFSWARPTQQPNESWVSRKTSLSILSFCCRELIWDLEVRASRACPSKPPNKNQKCKS